VFTTNNTFSDVAVLTRCAMSWAAVSKPSQMSGRGGKFVDNGVDTSSFEFKPGDASIVGAPVLPEEEEKKRIDTLSTLVKISDTDDPVVASMCNLVRSVFEVPLAGKSLADYLVIYLDGLTKTAGSV
jgi:hypothetical protein